MRGYPNHRPAEPFFLAAADGERFCIYHAANADIECRGAFIYVPPFGDEMNTARRMAALQARAFTAIGFSVLQIDLFGCGDSSGEFVDATWEIWKKDLATAIRWLENRVSAPISLWGLRLGALLALDFANDSKNAVDKIILWQPIVSGELFLTQFLRLRIASEMLAEVKEKNTGTHAMRAALAAGKSLEVAGYEIAPALAAAIDALDAGQFRMTENSVHWLEIVSEPGRPMPPARARVVSTWEQQGVDAHVHLVSCAPFWSTQEIAECPTLLSATTQIFSSAQS